MDLHTTTTAPPFRMTRKARSIIEAKPYALSSFVTGGMERRIAEAMRETAWREGHRPKLPTHKQVVFAEMQAARATLSGCIVAMLQQRPMTLAELCRETGLLPQKAYDSLRRLQLACKVEIDDANPRLHVYSLVRKSGAA